MELRFSPSVQTIANRSLSNVHYAYEGCVASSPRFSRFNTDYSTRYSPVKRSWKQVGRTRLVRLADSMTEQRPAKREQNGGVSRRVAEPSSGWMPGGNECEKRGEEKTAAMVLRAEKSRTIPQSFGPLPTWLFTSRTPCDAPAKHRDVHTGEMPG